MFGYYNGGWGMMGFGWIFFILVIILIIYILRSNNKDDKDGKQSAKSILNERYARGEIDLHEYNEKKKNLEE
jgi:putative membrane protein